MQQTVVQTCACHPSTQPHDIVLHVNVVYYRQSQPAGYCSWRRRRGLPSRARFAPLNKPRGSSCGNVRTGVAVAAVAVSAGGGADASDRCGWLLRPGLQPASDTSMAGSTLSRFRCVACLDMSASVHQCQASSFQGSILLFVSISHAKLGPVHIPRQCKRA